MHNSGNQLGSGPEKKSLTNEEISETLSKLTGDSEQAKKIFDQSETGALDIKGNEKFFRNISNYFQNKGGETNLDNLLEQIQTGKLDDLFKNQPETADEELPPEKVPAAEDFANRGRRNRESTDFEDLNDDEEYGGTQFSFILFKLNP